MKNILISTTILVSFFSQSVLSQSYFESMSLFKKNNDKEMTFKTARIEDRAALLPPSYLKRNKITSNKFVFETTVSLYIDEYTNNKHIKNEDNLLDSRTYSSNDYFSAEIVADTSNLEKLTIYTMLPGTISYKYRYINKDHKFKSIPFAYNELNNDENIPIIFLYEDDINNSMEKIINKYTRNDSLLIHFDCQKKPFSEIKRYIAIYYTSTSKK